jgi:hypothetical protein
MTDNGVIFVCFNSTRQVLGLNWCHVIGWPKQVLAVLLGALLRVLDE